MNQYDFPAPFSNDRIQYLESGVLKDYTNLTDEELKTEVQARNLMLYDLRRPRKDIHYAKALQASDRKDLEKYQTWKLSIELPLNPTPLELWTRSTEYISIMKARERHVFESAYKANPHKVTFLDIPGELRNSIYEYAMFGYELAGLSREFHVPSDFTGTISLRRDRWDPRYIHQSLSIHILFVLCAMNKQTCSEARALFWAKLRPSLCSRSWWQMETLQQFLVTIGSEGQASITSLEFKLHGLGAFPQGGFGSILEMLPTLGTCASLQSLNLQLLVSSFFRREINSLKRYFISEHTLVSHRLDLFTDTLIKLPNLKTIHLEFLPCTIFCSELEISTGFAAFAFSGRREAKLWMEVKERIQASNHHGKHITFRAMKKDVEEAIFMELHDETMDYEVWKNHMHPRRARIHEQLRIMELYG